MKAALIGYGKMGREIAALLRQRGHEVVLTIDLGNESDFTEEKMKCADVAIEFTTPETAFGNVVKCLKWGVPVVSGTTGWNDKLGEAKLICEMAGGTFFYASNYSIGVNVFFRINEYLAGIMNGLPEYDVSIREVHHVHKKDSPSGTAATLAEAILEKVERKSSWVNHETLYPESLGILSEREGAVPGIHEVRYESEADVIEIIHSAKSRAGFALGAVMAAEFTQGRKGVLSMRDMFGF